MDFIDGLLNSQGYNSLWVVVDCLTKYGHFVPLKHFYIAKTVTNSFMKNIFKLHGLPQLIVFDRDTIFTSQFWQETFKLKGVQMAMSTSYHPQIDG